MGCALSRIEQKMCAVVPHHERIFQFQITPVENADLIEYLMLQA